MGQESHGVMVGHRWPYSKAAFIIAKQRKFMTMYSPPIREGNLSA